MTFRPTILKAEPNRELRWLGHLLVPGLFDGEHIFTIETWDLIWFDSHSEKFSQAYSSRFLHGGWMLIRNAVLKK